MSIPVLMDNNLLMHLACNKIGRYNRIVLDESGQDNNAIAKGDPQVVSVATFGKCLAFNGETDYLQLPSVLIHQQKDERTIFNGFTFSTWLYCDESEKESEIIIDLGNGSKSDNIQLMYNSKEKSINFILFNGNNQVFNTTIFEKIKVKEWIYLSITLLPTGVKKAQLSTYLNGVFLKNYEIVEPNLIARQINTIAGSNTNEKVYFNGQIAHCRIYTRALSLEEINWDKAEDSSAAISFRRSYPIDFSLFDEDDQPVIYITDHPQGQNLYFEIINAASQPIEVRPFSDVSALTKENCHFELIFKPGMLSEQTLNNLSLMSNQTQDWHIETKKNTDNSISVYFQAQKQCILQAGEHITLTLTHVSAEGSSGARGTQVKLNYYHLWYPQDQIPLVEGERDTYINIISHHGQKNVPLILNWQSTNRILNTLGEKREPINNILILELINTSINDIHLADNTEFTLKFDLSKSDSAWALTDSTSKIKIKMDGADIPKEAEQDIWIIKKSHFKNNKGVIPAGESISITIEVKTTYQSGYSNVYLDYSNIPGFWQGNFLTTIEKSPIDIYQKQVGIGTPTAKAPLHIAYIPVDNNEDNNHGLMITRHDIDSREIALHIANSGYGFLKLAGDNNTIIRGDSKACSEFAGSVNIAGSFTIGNITINKITQECHNEENALPTNKAVENAINKAIEPLIKRIQVLEGEVQNIIKIFNEHTHFKRLISDDTTAGPNPYIGAHN